MLKLYSFGMNVPKSFSIDGKEIRMKGQVLDYYAPFWRIHNEDGNWKEC